MRVYLKNNIFTANNSNHTASAEQLAVLHRGIGYIAFVLVGGIAPAKSQHDKVVVKQVCIVPVRGGDISAVGLHNPKNSNIAHFGNMRAVQIGIQGIGVDALAGKRFFDVGIHDIGS
ncbi:MAG: hypothetical protein IPM98_15560 [Lewinellaceae bacterium]|nr:hypothetical protein [Lewinellaceae bacterium]